MEDIKQKYCIVATCKTTGKRKSISGPMSKAKCEQECIYHNENRAFKKMYKYAKIAKYPYKER